MCIARRLMPKYLDRILRCLKIFCSVVFNKHVISEAPSMVKQETNSHFQNDDNNVFLYKANFNSHPNRESCHIVSYKFLFVSFRLFLDPLLH